MKKLAGLRANLVAGGHHPDDQLVSQAEDMEIEVLCAVKGDSLLLYRMEYRAVFWMEGYAYQKHPVEILLARVAAWLADNDQDRDQLDKPEPELEPDVLDDFTADLELSVNFREDVYAVQDDNGNIEIQGRRYRLSEAEMSIADAFKLTAKVEDAE